MSLQAAFDFDAPRDRGTILGELCESKAHRVSDLYSQAAAKFIVQWLRRHGPMSGESLTDAAMDHGYRPHDTRAFGPVYAKLARAGDIRCVGYCPRGKGHGTAGGRLWSIPEASNA